MGHIFGRLYTPGLQGSRAEPWQAQGGLNSSFSPGSEAGTAVALELG